MKQYRVTYNNNGETIIVDYNTSSDLGEFEQQIQTEVSSSVVPFTANANCSYTIEEL